MHKPHAIFLLALCLALPACADDTDMKSITEKTRKQYPNITHVEPEKVAAWLKEDQKIIFLDVREEAEFGVSHLNHAQHVAPNEDIHSLVKQLESTTAPDTKVVLYCSVGVRSAQMTERLKKAGVKNVFNMSGSIFQWANEGRPLVRGKETVTKVHPYNAKWGKLLKPELRADVDPIDQKN